MKIFFDSDKAWTFLQKNGFVITLRAHKADGYVNQLVPVQIWRKGKDTGFVGNKVFIWVFSPVDSPERVDSASKWSGFKDGKEWLTEAELLSGRHSAWDAFYVHFTNRVRVVLP